MQRRLEIMWRLLSNLQHQHQVEGHNISLKLDKQLIDKACKKGGFHPNFEVTLYLIKPDNQSDLQLPSAAAANTATANQHEVCNTQSYKYTLDTLQNKDAMKILSPKK